MSSEPVEVIVVLAVVVALMWWHTSRMPALPAPSGGQSAPDIRSNGAHVSDASYDLDLLRRIPAEYAGRADFQQVVLINDAVTPMDIVIFVVQNVFKLSDAVAFPAMMSAHTDGECVIAMLPAELAAERIAAAREIAEKAGGYPLQIIARPLPSAADQPA